MLERMTFLLGICVSAIAALFTYVTQDLTSVPTLDYGIGRAVDSKDLKNPKHVVVTLRNISRREPLPSLKLQISGVDSEDKGCINGQPGVIGSNWTKQDPPAEYDNSDSQHAYVAVDTLTPGSDLNVFVPVSVDCRISVAFHVEKQEKASASPANIRIVTSGYEGFLIRNYLIIISVLAAFFSTVFLIAFIIACRLSLNKNKSR